MGESVDHSFPFTRKNWSLFLLGLAAIILGYALLSIPPATKASSRAGALS